MSLAISVSAISRVISGLLLILASLSKILTFRWFVNTLAKFKLVPVKAVGPAAIGVILGELFLGALILSARFEPWAVYGAVVLFSLFSAVLLMNLVRGHVDINCGCFGLWSKDKVGWQLVLRNLGFSGLALLCLWPNQWSVVIFPYAFLALSLLLVAAPMIVRAFQRTRPTAGRAEARSF